MARRRARAPPPPPPLPTPSLSSPTRPGGRFIPVSSGSRRAARLPPPNLHPKNDMCGNYGNRLLTSAPTLWWSDCEAERRPLVSLASTAAGKRRSSPATGRVGRGRRQGAAAPNPRVIDPIRQANGPIESNVLPNGRSIAVDRGMHE